MKDFVIAAYEMMQFNFSMGIIRNVKKLGEDEQNEEQWRLFKLCSKQMWLHCPKGQFLKARACFFFITNPWP